MANGEESNRWRRIQVGVKDTERLIQEKDYNSAMIKSRQTLEFMVKLLAERDNLSSSSDLKTMIDNLYQNRRISRSTCEHYHKIRMIGNKAAHEGSKSSHSANQAYRLLSQEMYNFTDVYQSNRRGVRQPPSRPSAQKRNYQRRRPGKKKIRAVTSFDLLKVFVPILCIVVLFFAIKLIKPSSKDGTPSSQDISSLADATFSDHSVAPPSGQEPSDQENNSSNETTPSTSETSAVVYKAATELNVRPRPSTANERLGLLLEGTTVEYVREYDSQWTVIMYKGQEAYVASEFLTKE